MSAHFNKLVPPPPTPLPTGLVPQLCNIASYLTEPLVTGNASGATIVTVLRLSVNQANYTPVGTKRTHSLYTASAMSNAEV